MSRLLNTWRKAQHAGFAWSVRAIWKRGLNKILRRPFLRSRIDSASIVDDDAFARLTETGPEGRFADDFFGKHFLDDAMHTAQLVREQFPEAAEHTMMTADAICRREFCFLGAEVTFNETIDWFWMPDGKGRWPLKHVDQFKKSEYYGEDRIGDIKYPWELARHQYFTTLGKAFQYTGDEKYAAEITRQILDWINSNPVRQGIHWISEMEFGIRIISWSNAYWLVRDSQYFIENGLRPFLKHLYEHARYLDRMLTTHWLIANNHLLGEAAGLFAFSVLFPRFPESTRWRQKSLRIFTQALEQQVFQDGVNREQATGYHRFVVDFIWIVVRLGEVNDVLIPKSVYDRLEAMLEYEAAITPPNGLVPQVGDCDDGRGIFLSESVPFFDFRGWLAAGATQFNRSDLAQLAQGGNEETAWLLGNSGWSAFKSLKLPDRVSTSQLFKVGGHAVLRTDGLDSATYVFVRCGEFGLGGDGSCVHSHADILAPIIFWKGIPLTVDAGTFAYYCSTKERDSFRSSSVHSTMTPQGIEPSEMQPIFNWGVVPRSRILNWRVSSDETVFIGETKAPSRFTHQRTITLIKNPLELRIEDQFQALSEYTDRPIEFRLVLAPSIVATIQSDTLVELAISDTEFARLDFVGFSKASIISIDVSPSYGVRIPSQCLVLSLHGSKATTSVSIRPAP